MYELLGKSGLQLLMVLQVLFSEKRLKSCLISKLLFSKNTKHNYINFSNKTLSNDKVRLLSKGLKLIPTPPVPSSNKSLLNDSNNFDKT